MPLRLALAHPIGLVILVASLIVGVALWTIPSLRIWSDRAAWLLAWGLVAYIATVLVLKATRAEVSTPELRQVRAIRHVMAGRLAELQANGAERSDLARVIGQAMDELDKQVIPALQQAVTRQQALTRQLASYEHGNLPPPDLGLLGRLHTIHLRRQRAIEECLQQAANADATLVALLQEGDDTRIAEAAREWADDLLMRYDTLVEVLRDDEPLPVYPERVRPAWEAPRDPEPPTPATGRATLTVVPLNPLANGSGPVTGEAPPSDTELVRHVEDALRRLNNPAALTKCALLDHLPHTLRETRGRRSAGALSEPTPLEQAKALAEVLTAAIEQLKPASDDRDAEALQYHILNDEYCRGMSNKHILARRSISESTFHRYRRQAIVVVARELGKREELLAFQHQASSSKRNPTALDYLG